MNCDDIETEDVSADLRMFIELMHGVATTDVETVDTVDPVVGDRKRCDPFVVTMPLTPLTPEVVVAA